ncbi:prion-inhibition and propagation-domain-containing protein [Lophiotrema nucula]|uniref:Prion-inhibition and propagation-domain-containing protein n=1 Tax=Lophiotrema nucula TaxID=690887 RepID=A0A6A5Z6U9_9PLEO|nr:prion-inhibition and propagation-domain-containing protein [Lophiotrema nucula]
MAQPQRVALPGLHMTCLNGCVKGLVVLSKAKHYNRDVSDVRLRTQLALHSLTTWAEEAGLMQEPPTLLMSANNAALVPEILGQLETLLLDLHQLEQRYGLYLQPTSEDVEALYDDDITLAGTVHKQHEYTKRPLTIFRKRKEPWKRLRWVTLDDKKFGRLLDKAKSYIGEMERFLEQAKQERRDRYLEHCLRDAILNASGPQELGVIGTEYEKAPSKLAIAAAAKLKRTRLMLGFSDSASTSLMMPHLSKSLSVSSMGSRLDSAMISKIANSEPKEMKLSMRLLTLTRVARAQPLRTLAQYDGRTVLLEWKNVADMADPTISKRVNEVAALLQDLGPMFHSLQCRGFVSDFVDKRYGYIFDLPEELDNSSQAVKPKQPGLTALGLHPELRSLRQALDEVGVPSLNLRLSLAVTLLENLLNLHTSGWLHKELRSDNVILIRDTNTPRENVTEELASFSIYVAGYVYSRVDSPGEMTEPLRSELEADLYRHPSLLSDSRQSYRKSLDIFSVGCTLLEIGLWSSFRQILEYHSAVRSDIAVPSWPARSISDPTLAHSNSFEQVNSSHEKASIDLMKLKHDLLISHLTVSRPKPTPVAVTKRSMIMTSLEAAMGERFTNVVEEFLAAGNTTKETKADEHEFALDLEMRARDIVRGIAGSI